MAALSSGRVVSKAASAYILSSMRPIAAHRWGLGTIGAGPFKGGWLRSDTVTRQMGIVDGYAVAIITDARRPRRAPDRRRLRPRAADELPRQGARPPARPRVRPRLTSRRERAPAVARRRATHRGAGAAAGRATPHRPARAWCGTSGRAGRPHGRGGAERRPGLLEPAGARLRARRPRRPVPAARRRGAEGVPAAGRGPRALPRRDGRGGRGRAVERLADGHRRVGVGQRRVPARHPRPARVRGAPVGPAAAGLVRRAVALDGLDQQQEHPADARLHGGPRRGRRGQPRGTRAAVGPGLADLPRRRGGAGGPGRRGVGSSGAGGGWPPWA